MRVLGLFDHAGVRRHQNLLPAIEQVPGPYCVQWLMDEGIDLDPVKPASSRLHRKVRDVVEHRSGIPWDIALRGLAQARKSDAVLALLEDKALAPGILRTRGLGAYKRQPLVTVSCWWAEELSTGSEEKCDQIRRALSRVDQIIVFSENQREIFARAGFPLEQVTAVRFGVDPDWYCPAPDGRGIEHRGRRIQVLASGIDRGRDFDSLTQAARHLPEVSFTVVTQPGRIRNPPPNMETLAPVSMDEHRQILRTAELVVVPTHNLAYPTGQSVLLEAMACGRPTAVTATGAMQDYIRDGDANLALPLADSEGIAEVISRSLADPTGLMQLGLRARTLIEDSWNFRTTWSQVANLFKSLN